MAGEDTDFVTIAEAARRLDVDPRQVRRYLTLLDESDRTEDSDRTRTGQPITRVRLSALMTLRQRRLSLSDTDRTLRKQDRTKKRTGHTDNTVLSDAPQGDRSLSERAVIAEVKAELMAAENARLLTALDYERDAHKRSQLLHLNTQGELQALRTRAAELEAANVRLIGLLPSVQSEAQTEGANTDSPAPVTVPDPVDAPGDESGQVTTEAAAQGESRQYGAPKKRVGLLQRLFSWMKDN